MKLNCFTSQEREKFVIKIVKKSIDKIILARYILIFNVIKFFFGIYFIRL